MSCLEGYVLRGPDLITCQISGGGAEWDLDNVKCEGEFAVTKVFSQRAISIGLNDKKSLLKIRIGFSVQGI